MMTSLAAVLVLATAAAGPTAPAASTDWVDRTLARLTLREKVAQMMMPYVPGGPIAQSSADWRRAVRLVVEEKVGGIIVGKGSARGTAALLNGLQRRAAVPLLVGADLEWGAGTRLEGATVLPINMAIAAAGDVAYAYEAGRLTALEARAAGVHLAFAPVADVNINAANPVINTRSYGAEPVAVAERVAAFIRGAAAGGLLTTAKHFPGHGDTELDSHLALPVVDASRARLEAVELVPFRAAIAAGVAAIMTAHLAVPALDPEGERRPATLSRPILTELLRREMGFEGLIVTDGLMMDAIQRGRTMGEIAVQAVRAGVDILLMPPSTEEAIDALVAAVEAGELDPARIDASVRRILEAKAAAGLDRERLVDVESLPARLGVPAHEAWAEQVAERSLTLVRDWAGVVPTSVEGLRVLSIRYTSSRSSDAGEVFDETLESEGADVRSVHLSRRSSDARLRRAERAAAEADLVVISSYARAVPWSGTLALPEDVARLVNRLGKRGAVLISFGNPYLLDQVGDVGTYLLAWSDADVAQRAAARALAGRIVVAGRLPVPLPPAYAVGDGISRGSLAGEPASDGAIARPREDPGSR
ncbi:MAG TPA: glycoside hydrolase family 3 protein [Longimicrobiales bacterium]